MRRSSVCVLVFVGLSQACVGDSPVDGAPVGTANDAGADAAQSTGDGSVSAPHGLALSVAPVEIVRGQPATFTLTLDWTGAPTDVSVTVLGPPGTTSSGPVTVPLSATTQTVTLATDTTLAYGEQSVQFTATAPGASAVQTTTTLFVRGEPGALDTSFGDQGRATPPPGEPLLAAIAVDEDGKFHASGLTPAGLVVARYDAEGHLDPTFAVAGVSACPPPATLHIGSFLHPWSTTRAGSAYDVGYVFSGTGQNHYPLRASFPDQGPCAVIPSLLPAATPSGDALPQGDGLIGVTSGADGIARYDALGAVDTSWSASPLHVIPPEIVGATSFYIQVISASATRILMSGRASNGSTDLWQGFALIDRGEGKVITRFASDVSTALGAGTAPDGTSYVFAEGATFLRIAADGAQTTPTSSFFVAESELHTFGSMSFTADGSPVLLITNSETQLERAVLLDKDLQATQSTVNLESPHVAVNSLAGASAIVDSKRRIIVFHAYDDDAQDPNVVSAHWMIRRYWL